MTLLTSKKNYFFFWRFCFWKKWFFSRGGGDSWWYVKYVWMNSRQKSATFVTVRRAMTNFDPLWLKKKWWNQSPHPRQNLWSLLSLGVAPLTRAWQPRCCFHQCMFFELSYVAIRLWLEDQTDKGDFKVESSVWGAWQFLMFHLGVACLFIFGRHKGQGWSIAVVNRNSRSRLLFKL